MNDIDHLQPDISPIDLPGPFDYGVGLGRYSRKTFHRRTAMGTLLNLTKYHYSTRAADRLAACLISYLESVPLPDTPDLLVTIPDTLTNRPFSPTVHIANAAAAHFDWAVRHDIIRRFRLEKPQKDRSFEERLNDTHPRYNLAEPDAVRNKSILLFDDIYATGRSMIEATELIRGHSPRTIMALTLVRLYRD